MMGAGGCFLSEWAVGGYPRVGDNTASMPLIIGFWVDFFKSNPKKYKNRYEGAF